MKKGFTLIELLVVITIIGILSTIGLNSFTSSQKKARDAKRKSHLRSISQALEAYYNDKGQYPLSNASGQILGCAVDAEELCAWGEIFSNTTPDPNPVYMIELPADPSVGNNYWYQADSNGRWWQLYARLENTNDADVPTNDSDEAQVYGNLYCNFGTLLECNYGISSTNTSPATGQSLITDPTL